jgi:hypothetical protein
MLERKLSAKVLYDGHGGEPFIIMSKSGKTYVGSYVQKGAASYFDLYDGESTDRVARLEMPGRVPYGFHGLWIGGDELRDHFDFHSTNDQQETRTLESV